MSLEVAQRVADAVLWEGYVLYPYRASAVKNRFRWQFGVLAPRDYGVRDGEPWAMQTECLIEPESAPAVDVRIRSCRCRRGPWRRRGEGTAIGSGPSKREARGTDERARQVIDRTDALPTEPDPVQAAAGFLAQIPDLPGRLFDTVAALLGFTRGISFEGQAAIWLEHLARQSPPVAACPFPVVGPELDFRPALRAVVSDRLRGRPPAEIARAFHRGLAAATAAAAAALRETRGFDAVVLSGGVFQNELLVEDLRAATCAPVWTNSAVPPNDGGISLGQAALAPFIARYAGPLSSRAKRGILRGNGSSTAEKIPRSARDDRGAVSFRTPPARH